MTKTYCDKCERELEFYEQIDINATSRINGRCADMCLCAKCWNDFEKWLNGEEKSSNEKI